MSTATSAASPRATAPAAMNRSASAGQRTREPERALRMGKDEAAVLNLDLGGLELPKVGGLNVDGFKPSFFERLFGKR